MLARMNVNSIRRILLEEWDPLGVGSNPKLSDEYDSYIPAIFHMLQSNCTFNQVFVHLKEIENNLGVRTPNENTESAATQLLALSV